MLYKYNAIFNNENVYLNENFIDQVEEIFQNIYDAFVNQS